jgi:hypothetical protein
MLVRATEAILDPRWIVCDIGLEELVLAYMAPSPPPGRSHHELAAVRP